MRVSRTTPSGISTQSCKALFLSTNEYALTNPAVPSALAWFSVESENTNSPAYSLLKNVFGLDDQQMADLLAWRQIAKAQFEEQIVTTLGVSTLTEIGLLQWANGSVTESIKFLLPSSNFPATPEL